MSFKACWLVTYHHFRHRCGIATAERVRGVYTFCSGKFGGAFHVLWLISGSRPRGATTLLVYQAFPELVHTVLTSLRISYATPLCACGFIHVQVHCENDSVHQDLTRCLTLSGNWCNRASWQHLGYIWCDLMNATCRVDWSLLQLVWVTLYTHLHQ